MKQYVMFRGAGSHGLEMMTAPEPPLGASEVRVQVRAVSLNARDLMLSDTPSATTPTLVPGSDAAGEVLEVGSRVTDLRPGDRVVSSFFPDWIDGQPSAENTATSLGSGLRPGALAEQMVLPASAWVPMPSHMSFEEAATLPCAGVTAWQSLFGGNLLQPDATVLVLGTGGVSLWALQLARAVGLRVIVTSSDDSKLERARVLGAVGTVNYLTQPDWDAEVRALTDGKGTDLVLETGGRATLARSIAAARVGGEIALIGGTSGAFGGELPPFALIDGAQTLRGVLVGSVATGCALSDFCARRAIRPVIDRVFAFEHAAEAYEHLRSGRHFGKVVVTLSDGEAHVR